MKNKHIFIPLFVFLGAGCISLIASIIDYTAVNKEFSYASEVLQFDYDGASDGKDPNGDPFNAVDFLSDDMISKSLETTGVSAEIEKVRTYLTVNNVVPKNIVKEIEAYASVTDGDQGTITSNDYHPVRYRFSLYSDLGLSESKTKELLGNIVDTYCDEFYKAYMMSFDKETYDSVYSAEECDYIYQAQVFTNKLDILMNYAENLYEKHDDFKSDNGTFRDLYNKCRELVNTDVSKIRNLITLNALSKDLPRLKDYYTFKIQRLNYDKNKYQSDLNSVSAQLSTYTKDSTVFVSNGETIVKVESNSSETYDALLASQINLSNNIARVNTEINEYNAILADINATTGTEEEYALVKRYLAKLGTDYENVENVFVSLLEAYNQKYVSKGVISKSNISYTSGSIISASFIVRCIKIAAPIMLATMLGISIYYLIRAVRKEKKVA